MDVANYEIIQAMYDELEREQTSDLTTLNKMKNEIDEIDAYLNNLLSREENDDLRVFLPRKVEGIYHDVIEENKKKRERLVLQCDELEKSFSIKNDKMIQLEKILSDSSMLHVKQLFILDAQEKERQRIARDLHDTSLQNLTNLVHKVELTSMYIDKDSVRAKLELATIEKGIRKVIDEIRNSIFDLRPMSFDDLGLRETIEKLLSVLNSEHQFHIITDIDKIEMGQYDSSMRILCISIYRIIQECVQNSMKHSGGNEISVILKEHDNEYCICICDNGSGFNLDEAMKKDKHFGLSVVRERVMFLGGTLDIESSSGTFIKIVIPKI